MVSCSISSPALSIILNGELVFVAFVMRYPRALVYGQFPFLIDVIVKVSVFFCQGSLAFVSKASKWLEKR